MVLRTMRIMMKYSNGVDTTTLQILYLNESISFGMYRSRGLAWMAKSMQDFWKRERNCLNNNIFALLVPHRSQSIKYVLCGSMHILGIQLLIFIWNYHPVKHGLS